MTVLAKSLQLFTLNQLTVTISKEKSHKTMKLNVTELERKRINTKLKKVV